MYRHPWRKALRRPGKHNWVGLRVLAKCPWPIISPAFSSSIGCRGAGMLIKNFKATWILHD